MEKKSVQFGSFLFIFLSVRFCVRTRADIVTVVVKNAEIWVEKFPTFKILRFKAFRGVDGGLCF